MVRYGAEDLEARLQVLFQVHNGSDIAAAVAVVGSGPYRHDILVLEMVLYTVSALLSWPGRRSLPYNPR